MFLWYSNIRPEKRGSSSLCNCQESSLKKNELGISQQMQITRIAINISDLRGIYLFAADVDLSKHSGRKDSEVGPSECRLKAQGTIQDRTSQKGKKKTKTNQPTQKMLEFLEASVQEGQQQILIFVL